MDLHVDSLQVDPFGFNRDSHHHHHHLPLPDFSTDDSPPHFNDPLSPKHSLKDLDESLHSKPLFHSQHNELLDDFMAPNSPSPVDSPTIRESDEPHTLDLPSSTTADQAGTSLPQITIPIVLPPGGTTVIDGVTYNNRGYEVCGALNKFNKPCQRIGRCPFHPEQKKADPPPPVAIPNEGLAPVPAPEPRRFLPIKKGPYKSGWKKDEHLRFLKGLQIHGRGSWKDIALIVGTRTPTQIQVHAHRYYLRQQQGTKNKRSIHDISLEDLEELEVQHGSIMQGPPSPLPQLSPPSPDNGDNSHDLSHLFQTHSTFSHHNNNNNIHNPPSPPMSHPIHSSATSFTGSTNSSTNFPPLFPSGSSSSLAGLLPLQLPMPASSAPFSMNYHASSSWFNPSPYNMPPMNDLGDDNLAALHLPPPSDHKLLSPLQTSFSQDDYEDDDELTDSDFSVTHSHLTHIQDEDEEVNGD